MFEQLHIVSTLCGIFTLKEDVRVGVDHAGQNSVARVEVDGLSAGGRCAALADTLNPVSADDDGYVVPDLRRGPIDQVSRVDGDQLLRLRGLCGDRGGA